MELTTGNKHLTTYILLLCPLLVFYGFNHQNVPLQFSLLLGIIVFPYVVRVGEAKSGFRYALLAAGLGILLLFYRSSTLYYFFAIFILFFVLENWWGRLNYLPLLLAVAVSPILSSMVYIWSFPIRLELSQWAGRTLRWLQMDIEVNGNVLILDGNTFAVDPACMGLKMVITSVVLGIVILAHNEKKYNNALPFWQTLVLLGSLLLGAVFANFIRLLMLIIFHILPENPMHYVVGLLSLGLYVLLPFYFFTAFFFGKKNKKSTTLFSDKKSIIHTKVAAPIKLTLAFLLLLQIYNGLQFLQTNTANISAIENIQIAGLKSEIANNGVLKLQNDEVLLYIKPPVRFFQGSHDPRFCWQGSGYNFSEVQIETIAGKIVYTATLIKDTDKMYTAWWYENAGTQRPFEWKWRWKSLQGAGSFYMINITCTEEIALKKWIEKDILQSYE